MGCSAIEEEEEASIMTVWTCRTSTADLCEHRNEFSGSTESDVILEATNHYQLFKEYFEQ
jgi:hypothetical protein